jgi:hypothetical protein
VLDAVGLTRPRALVLADNALEDAAPSSLGRTRVRDDYDKTPNHPIDKHVGTRLRMRRMMLGLTQEKLGEAFGVTFQQVQKYERVVNRMGASRLQQAAGILDVGAILFRRDARRT